MYNLLVDVDLNHFSVMFGLVGSSIVITGMSHVMEKTTDQDTPLNSETSEKKVESKWRKTISFKESHQETETDNNHNVCILVKFETYAKNRPTFKQNSLLPNIISYDTRSNLVSIGPVV